MPPRAQPIIYTQAKTLVLDPGESLGREDGTSENMDYHFVESRVNPPSLEYYYRALFRVYGGRDSTLGKEPYDQAR